MEKHFGARALPRALRAFEHDLKCKKSNFPAEGRTFLRTLGAQRASVRSFVRPSKGTCFQNGSSLRNRMKLNMCTYLEHECIRVLTRKTEFDYKRAFIHNALQARFYCRI